MATIIINDDHTICGACGGSTTPDATSHITFPDGTLTKCGAKFTHHATNERRLSRLMPTFRGDTQYIGVVPWKRDNERTN